MTALVALAAAVSAALVLVTLINVRGGLVVVLGAGVDRGGFLIVVNFVTPGVVVVLVRLVIVLRLG